MLISTPTTSSSPYTRDTAICPTTPADEQPCICTICLEHLHTPTPPARLPELNASVPEHAVTIKQCGHVFGQNCLEHWMRDSNTCPVCRIEFFDMPKVDIVVEEDQDIEGSGVQHYVMGVYLDSETMARLERMSVEDGEGRERRRGGPYYEDGRTVWYA